MRMSKSIKDYKDAMDNIKISDSFYKRTENLLTELSEVTIEKKSSFGGGKVTAGIMAAAACIVCVIGLRIALDGRKTGIDTAAPDAPDVTETIIETTEGTAPPLIDEVEYEASIFDGLDDPDMDASLDCGAVGVSAEADDMDEPEETTQTTQATTKKTSTTSQESGGSSKPAVTTAAPAATAAPKQEGAYKGGGKGYPDITVQGYENIPMMKDIVTENVTVEVTPYFDMGKIKSGEGSVKESGTELASVIDFISDIAESSTEIKNDSFKSIFSMSIVDENIGVTFYSIYLTDSGTLVITKHSANVQQRVTYLPTKKDYNTLKHTLFLLFGSEDDYPLFESLISGK